MAEDFDEMDKGDLMPSSVEDLLLSKNIIHHRTSPSQGH